jgi:predicted ATPase/DNA-binding CsgD family transcriptional regulator
MRDHHVIADRERRPPLAPVDRLSPPAPVALPAPLTRLIGREPEVAALRHALEHEHVRLLTITGAGGIGKTRLAMAVATPVSDSYSDGAFFVDLAPVQEPGQVVPSIAATLGVRESGDQPLRAGLARLLAGRRLLLLLDNCEHVLAAAPEIAGLLAAHPALTILATSREPLRVRGEHEFPLLPLDVPDPDRLPGFDALAATPAVALFVERASQCVPGFALTTENAAAVAAICRRLDGLPLGLELAASRVKVLSPDALLARLEPRLPLLTGGGRDLPDRHRTMRDAIAWSHDLLNPGEQALFRRLAVFSGGWTLAAAEHVGGERGHGAPVLDGLTSLVDKSLVLATGLETEARYTMLETIRDYALDRLRAAGEAETARGRHARWCLAFADEAARGLRGAEQPVWLERLEREHDNLRAALTWFLAPPDRADDALRLAGALHWFWYLRGHYREGRQWLEAALAMSSAPTLARARALAGSGVLGFPHGEFVDARERLRESIAIGRELGDPGTVAYGLHFLAMGDLPHTDPAESRARAEESIALFREAGDRWGLAMALRGLGMIALVTRRFDETDAPFAESLALTRDVGDGWCLARVLHYAGEVARARGDVERARDLYEESLGLYRGLDLRNPEAIVRHNLGYVALHQGDPRRGLSCFADALTTHVEHDNLLNVGHCLAGIACIAASLDHPEQAARLFGAADAILAHIGAAIWPVDKGDHDRHLVLVRERLGEDVFAATFAAGRALALEDAIAEGFAVRDEAEAGARAGQRPAAATANGAAVPGLSPREREILRLLTQRATDREIAAALSISPRTVMHHVSSILAKLGVGNRRDAAALATRHEMV